MVICCHVCAHPPAVCAYGRVGSCTGAGVQAAKKSVFKILDRHSKIDPFDDRGLKPSSIEGRVDFVNVSFKWVYHCDHGVSPGLVRVCTRACLCACVSRVVCPLNHYPYGVWSGIQAGPMTQYCATCP